MRVQSRFVLANIVAVILLTGRALHSNAQLILLDQFDPNIGTLVGLGFDSPSNTVWIHGDFDSTLLQYSDTGTFISSVSRPGESANSNSRRSKKTLVSPRKPQLALLAVRRFSGVSGSTNVSC